MATMSNQAIKQANTYLLICLCNQVNKQEKEGYNKECAIIINEAINKIQQLGGKK